MQVARNPSPATGPSLQLLQGAASLAEQDSSLAGAARVQQAAAPPVLHSCRRRRRPPHPPSAELRPPPADGGSGLLVLALLATAAGEQGSSGRPAGAEAILKGALAALTACRAAVSLRRGACPSKQRHGSLQSARDPLLPRALPPFLHCSTPLATQAGPRSAASSCCRQWLRSMPAAASPCAAWPARREALNSSCWPACSACTHKWPTISLWRPGAPRAQHPWRPAWRLFPGCWSWRRPAQGGQAASLLLLVPLPHCRERV